MHASARHRLANLPRGFDTGDSHDAQVSLHAVAALARTSVDTNDCAQPPPSVADHSPASQLRTSPTVRTTRAASRVRRWHDSCPYLPASGQFGITLPCRY